MSRLIWWFVAQGAFLEVPDDALVLSTTVLCGCGLAVDDDV
jgi:hypothetical protein